MTNNYSKKGHQDNLEGMIGTWAEDGIGCEECRRLSRRIKATLKNENSRSLSSLAYRLKVETWQDILPEV